MFLLKLVNYSLFNLASPCPCFDSTPGVRSDSTVSKLSPCVAPGGEAGKNVNTDPS